MVHQVPRFVPNHFLCCHRQFYSSILTLCPASFHVSIRVLDEASCVDPWSRYYFVKSLDSILLCFFLQDHWSDTQLSHPNIFTLASTLRRTCCEIFLELGRQRKPAKVRVALATFSLATLDPATRSSADVVLCHCLSLQTTDFHYLVHRRPGQGPGEGPTH